jgi:hypothetical protein
MKKAVLFSLAAFFSLIFTSQTAYAGVTGYLDCVKFNLGKCLPDQGAGACPSNTNKVLVKDQDGVMREPSCPENFSCCKGTTEGTAAGSAAEAKGQCPSPPNPPGSSFTKPGMGATPCGQNQCRPQGFLFFTDCLSESDCAANRGTTDGGNMAGCGEGTVCCRIKKNRCNDASVKPDKIYLCDSETSCTAKGGKLIGGGSGCNESGAYPKCCEYNDGIESPMLNAGEPLQGLGGSTGGKATPQNRVNRKYQNINSFCFTEMECVQYSGTSAWVKGNGCVNKGNTPQGYCKAPPPIYDLQYPLGGVKTIGDLSNFIGLIFNYAMGIIIIVAAVIFVYGGLRYMFAAVSNDVEVGKTIMMDSVIGLLLGLGAYAIMANVNFNTVNLRSFDVFMINRLSFFDNLYCSDVKPATGKTEVKFQEAGTPFAPEELDIKKGYPLSLKDTKCGHEYFIEGADSLSVCTGSSCNAGACLNCANGSKDCRVASEKEHVCVDANIAGNVVVAGNSFENEKMQAYLFCNKGGSLEFTKVGSYSMENKTITKGIVTGAASMYAIKFGLEEIKTFKNACSGQSGMIIEHHLKRTMQSFYYFQNKNCSFNLNKTEIFNPSLGSFPSIDGAFEELTVDKREAILKDAWPLDEVLKTQQNPITCNITLDIMTSSFWNQPNAHD